ncbi:THUMP domain-containing class I SAM-dependent RNA methyltransferase [Thauera chlorobenzoica]|uniref:23S rRNA (Guanine-N-2-)-methyltransferase RlmL n=1 Tax=Thauera chlorobenzoica TaxID=96773 RepID=A0A1H5W3P0_9RHOO|nr:THUMP domain-containing protein [Thauera chlorobenzoica]APR03362.1 23S rRNA (guanine-N-2-) -methyltransferase RlmL [Thauera chlorobenzoica]SEF94050.1 putative N6-adenine-specific DNA methylase [Thauera chlorobenzoica]
MAETFFSPCPRGLETLLAEELGRFGARTVQPLHGGVSWEGDWAACQRANLESRLATRVMWRVAQGRYRAEVDIYKLAYSVTWAKWFTADDTIRIYVTAQKSPLKSLEFITLRVKDAVCDHFRTVAGRRPNVDTADPAVRIHLFLTADTATLYIDTSGAPLYKRGFKPAAVEAPLKENLAAGILRLSGWTPGETLLDPMCGSGTFLIEAAMMALDIAPGLGRRFGFERFRHHERSTWAAVRRAAESRRQAPRVLPLFGSDIVGEWVRRSRVNLDAAGLADCVRLDRADLLERTPPAAEGVMVANPPYGVRLGEAEELAAFYPQLGDALKQRWGGWRCYFFSADVELPKRIGLKASRRTPLFNGALECRLYEYRMVAGSNRRKGDEAAAS